VFFTGAEAGAAQSWSDTRITVRVPSGAQSGPVRVMVGSRQSNNVDFAVSATSGRINPSSGPTAGGNRVSLTVSSLPAGAVVVLFGTNLATDVNLVPPNVITCTAPPGTGVVQVYALINVIKISLGSYTYR
jgi:hypothetical protein